MARKSMGGRGVGLIGGILRMEDAVLLLRRRAFLRRRSRMEDCRL